VTKLFPDFGVTFSANIIGVGEEISIFYIVSHKGAQKAVKIFSWDLPSLRCSPNSFFYYYLMWVFGSACVYLN